MRVDECIPKTYKILCWCINFSVEIRSYVKHSTLSWKPIWKSLTNDYKLSKNVDIMIEILSTLQPSYITRTSIWNFSIHIGQTVNAFNLSITLWSQTQRVRNSLLILNYDLSLFTILYSGVLSTNNSFMGFSMQLFKKSSMTWRLKRFIAIVGDKPKS